MRPLSDTIYCQYLVGFLIIWSMVGWIHYIVSEFECRIKNKWKRYLYMALHGPVMLSFMAICVLIVEPIMYIIERYNTPLDKFCNSIKNWFEKE